MKRVFIFVESDLRWHFFKRFISAFEELKYDIVFITNCPSVYLQAKMLRKKVYLLSRNSSKKYSEYIHIQEKDVLEVETGELSLKEANFIGNKWFQEISELNKKVPATLVFIYNGTTLLPYVAGIFSKKNNIPSCFFELANINGKMFVDPEGTNAKSYFYKNPPILKSECVLPKYNEWLDHYKKERSVVKQARFSSFLGTVFAFSMNKLYFLSYIHSFNDKINFFFYWLKKAQNRYKKHKYIIKNVREIKKEYYLFPMQVTGDSQVLLNSDIGLEKAINLAIDKSNNDGVLLVIKPHPAEQDKNVMSILNELEENNDNVIIINEDIKTLIKGAKKIITINSTAGLEGLLYGKKVDFLGKSFYANLIDENTRSKYIMEYLINIDYFSRDNIKRDILIKCINRAETVNEVRNSESFG